MAGQYLTEWGGRETDILFVQPRATPGEGVTTQSDLTLGGYVKYVTGIQKAVQSFVSLLYTRRGSSVSDVGCDFLSAIALGQVRTESDLRNQFTRAVSTILPQMNAQTWRADELVDGAALLSATVERQRITMRIRLTTAAGEAAAFLVPVERPA